MQRTTRTPDSGRESTRKSTDGSDASAAVGVDGPVAQLHQAVGNQTIQRQVTTASGSATGPGPTSFAERISGHVPTLEQPSSMSCWATATAMMLSWRHGASYSIEDAMRWLDSNSPTITYTVERGDTLWDIAETYYRDGTDYEKIQRATPRLSVGQSHIEPGWDLEIPEFWLTRFRNDVGLMDYHYDELLEVTGLVSEPKGTNWPIDKYRRLIRSYGPLWLTTDVDMDPGAGDIALHVRILTGIWGDGTPEGTTVRLVDPADGEAHEFTFEEFSAQFEEGMGLPSQTDQIQILHWP